MRIRFLALFLVLLSAAVAQKSSKAKREPQPSAIPLVATSSKVLSMPAFSAMGSAQCDAEGSFYMHSGYARNSLTILKVLGDGSHVIYHPSGQDAGDLFFVGFSITQDGKVRLLASNKQDELYILEAGDDPASFNRTSLNAPDGVSWHGIQSFLVLPNGSAWLQGYFSTGTRPPYQGRGYQLEFDARGRLVRKNLEETAGKDALNYLSGRPLSGASVAGNDGLIYVLEYDRISVISVVGEILRTIKLQPPEGFHPRQLFIAGPRLLVSFEKEDMLKPVVALYALIDRSSGEQLRLFRPDDELGNNVVCFSNEGLTFLGVDDQSHVKLMTAAAR